MGLEQAVAELSEIVPRRSRRMQPRVGSRELAADVQTARTPRAVVAGNIESWYAGPRSDDRNWSSLVEILREDGWNADALAALDESSTKVVANLPSPHDARRFQAEGLVLGYVQSGKTTNFTAVIAKAADAGYRFFIVLSGVHNGASTADPAPSHEQLSGAAIAPLVHAHDRGRLQREQQHRRARCGGQNQRVARGREEESVLAARA